MITSFSLRDLIPGSSDPAHRGQRDKVVGEVDKVVDVGPVTEGVASVRGVPLAAGSEPVLEVSAHHVVT